MKNNRPDNHATYTPESDKKKLLLPDQLDLIMEDGTIYHVRSFFADKGQMGDVLDALTMEKIDRRAKTLTTRMLNELIDRIEVHQADKIDGEWFQLLTIHYNCV